MTDNSRDLETIAGHWDFEYAYTVGETTRRFLREIRDNARIFGTRCDGCNRVLVPARSFCDRCYLTVTEWQEVGQEGMIETFTILSATLRGFPPPPVAIAYVTLDGADTAMANYLKGIDLTDVDVAGRALIDDTPRVRVVFHDQRQGRIGDFYYQAL